MIYIEITKYFGRTRTNRRWR